MKKILSLILTTLMLFGGTTPLLFGAAIKASDKKAGTKHKTAKEASVPKDPNAYPPILIGPGDILNIMVYGENGGGTLGREGLSTGNALPIEYQVDSDGVITFPYIGNVFLGGMTPAEASAKIAKLLFKPRKVTVLIKESNTYWVSILGSVIKPGKYQIHGKPTLLSALAEAGGPMPDADLGGTILIHRGNKQKLNLSLYLKDEGKSNVEPNLYPGDVLSVPKSGWPSLAEFAIIASVLASAAVITVQLTNPKN